MHAQNKQRRTTTNRSTLRSAAFSRSRRRASEAVQVAGLPASSWAVVATMGRKEGGHAMRLRDWIYGYRGCVGTTMRVRAGLWACGLWWESEHQRSTQHANSCVEPASPECNRTEHFNVRGKTSACMAAEAKYRRHRCFRVPYAHMQRHGVHACAQRRLCMQRTSSLSLIYLYRSFCTTGCRALCCRFQSKFCASDRRHRRPPCVRQYNWLPCNWLPCH